MKKLFVPFFTILFFANCNSNQSTAEEQAKQIQQTVNENSPGSVPVSADGFYMKAKKDGKDWVATSMDEMSEDAYRIIGNYNGEYISLPYHRNDIEVGNKTNFDHSAVDLKLNDEEGIWSGLKGQMIITKVDENSAEGTFYFTASNSSNTKAIEFTDGTFRILFPKK
ncbi:hypothetical protein BH10BAC3_BH10BAC3_16660 [soil metagenome]